VRPGAGVAPGRVEGPVAEAAVRAVSEGRRLSARYRGEGKRGGAFVLEPLGLVAEGGALTLVARATRSPEPRRFALSGFTSARVLDEASDDRGFDLDVFLDTADAVADVAVRVRGEALAALAGSPLADGQTVEPLGDDEGRVRARVPQGPALLGRLLALGGDAVVEAPAALAAQVAAIARAVAARYPQRKPRSAGTSRGRAGERATSKPQ
jgi:predicted DNA-binding transcriptional regulator YafY